MRADRLFSIVLLLQSHGQMTARTLARQLEVSQRTIHRDMEALSGAGIPVVAERGSGGGWSLLGEYRTNLTGLNEAEVQSLFVTGPTPVLADLNLDKAAEGALLKLLAALPSIYRRGAEYTRQRIHIDVTGWHATREAVPLLHVLQDAIWQERKVLMSYQRGESGSVDRLIDPLGLVAKGSVWYLVGAVEGHVRSYRVSRIQEAELTDDLFQRPPSSIWRYSGSNRLRSFGSICPAFKHRCVYAPTSLGACHMPGGFAESNTWAKRMRKAGCMLRYVSILKRWPASMPSVSDLS